MNGFLRTLVLGLALLFILVAALVLTVAMAAGGDVRARLRSWVLSPEEQATLRQEMVRPPAPSLVRPMNEPDHERLIQELADRVSSSQVKDLLADLRRRQSQLDEQRSHLDQREAELRIAEADLLRMQQELQRSRTGIEASMREAEARQAQFAQVQADALARVEVVDQVRKARLADQARLFETMGKAAWQSLRRFPPQEIALYLSLMETKKAAEIVKEANKDPDLPDLPHQIHRAWLGVDLDGLSGDRIGQLGALYAFMGADDVAQRLLEANSVPQAAGIIRAMQNQGSDKKAGQVLESLRRLGEDFERRVQRELSEGSGT